MSVSKRPKTLPEFFDEWRALYDIMPYSQYQQLYAMIAPILKQQKEPLEVNKFAIANFFRNIKEDSNIVEIGSWDGYLASLMIDKFDHIIDWTGFEMCKEVAQNGICKKDRFRSIIPDTYFWDCSIDYSRYNVMIIARFIERMKSENFIKILEQTSGIIEYVYIEMRLFHKSYLVDWSGTPNMGVFELGWEDLIELMQSFGYKKTYQYKHVGFFQRK